MEEIFNKLETLYNDSSNIFQWERHNVPDSTLIYKSGLSRQAKALVALPDILRSHPPLDVPKVIGYHTSKSVRLPVSCFRLWDGKGYAILRDNFYDIKLAIISKYDIHFPYHFVHKEYSQEQYDDEKQRAQDYRASVLPNDMIDYNDDGWFKKWSGDSIIRHDNRIYRAYTVSLVYCEGMDSLKLPNEVFTHYEDGKRMFTCSLGTYSQVGVVLDAIQSSMEHEFYLERNRLRDEGKIK